MLVKFCILGILAINFLATAIAEEVRSPRGWDDNHIDGVRVLTNGVATVRVEPWQHLEGETLKAWLQSLENTPPQGTQFISSAGVKKETVPGAYSVIRKVAFANSKGHSVLYACPGGNGYARLMTLDVTNANFKDTLVGAIFGERVCKRGEKPAIRAAADKPPSSEKRPRNVAKNERPTQSEQSSVKTYTSVGSTAPQGLVELRGVIVMGIQPGGMFGTTDDFIALFDDGSYTSDLVNTFGDGVQASRRKKPTSWGRWRTRNDNIELRDHDDTAYEKTRGTWRIEPSQADYRLSGCFGRLNSSSGADYNSGTTVGLARTWCFWPDGRFSNSSTAFGRSSNASMRATGDKGRGSYRIDGYVIKLTYDDGHTITAAFGYASEKGNHILLNGKRSMGAKR